MLGVVLLMGLTASVAAEPSECRTPPPAASSGYWTFIDSCGCGRLQAPPRASRDYDRFLKACAQWRERNLAAARSGAAARECGSPPARAAEGYWDYLDSCGCAGVDAPPSASSDHERFMKTCASWRERNPSPAGPDPEPTPAVVDPDPVPSPGDASPRPGGAAGPS